jgi:hypothetical protein
MFPPHAAALPPLPKAGAPRGGGVDDAPHAAAAGHAAAAAGSAAPELPPAGSTAGLDLTIHGTNRPFAAARGGSLAAAVEAAGQEQVNILNLPLPEAADVAQAPGGVRGSIIPPPARGAPQPEQLKEAEASVMRLEKELGTSHPEVGKAYLSLSRLYLAGCEDSAAKQLATAALSRSWEILNVCQVRFVPSRHASLLRIRCVCWISHQPALGRSWEILDVCQVRFGLFWFLFAQVGLLPLASAWPVLGDLEHLPGATVYFGCVL